MMIFFSSSTYLPICFCARSLCSQQKIYSNPRGGTAIQRGGKPGFAPQPDRPLPASYVCYRCGKKGLQGLNFQEKMQLTYFK